METLCERIKVLRKKSGLSQGGLAEKFNIPKSTIQDWEHERRVPPIYVVEMMEKLVDAPETGYKPSGGHCTHHICGDEKQA